WQAYRDLTDGIKKELFLEAPAAHIFPEAATEKRVDDAQIGLILRQIKSKWAQARPITPPDEKPEPADMTLHLQSATALEDGEATVIITPAKPPVQKE